MSHLTNFFLVTSKPTPAPRFPVLSSPNPQNSSTGHVNSVSNLWAPSVYAGVGDFRVQLAKELTSKVLASFFANPAANGGLMEPSTNQGSISLMNSSPMPEYSVNSLVDGNLPAVVIPNEKLEQACLSLMVCCRTNKYMNMCDVYSCLFPRYPLEENFRYRLNNSLSREKICSKRILCSIKNVCKNDRLSGEVVPSRKTKELVGDLFFLFQVIRIKYLSESVMGLLESDLAVKRDAIYEEELKLRDFTESTRDLLGCSGYTDEALVQIAEAVFASLGRIGRYRLKNKFKDCIKKVSGEDIQGTQVLKRIHKEMAKAGFLDVAKREKRTSLAKQIGIYCLEVIKLQRLIDLSENDIKEKMNSKIDYLRKKVQEDCTTIETAIRGPKLFSDLMAEIAAQSSFSPGSAGTTSTSSTSGGAGLARSVQGEVALSSIL